MLLVIAFSARALAGNWNASAAVAPGVTYTDNVCLSQSNKKSEWIGTLTPSGSIRGNTARSSVAVTGSVQLNTLANSSLNSKGCNGIYDDRDQYNPRLNAKASTILIDNWMTLDVSGVANQNAVTSRASGGGDDFNRTGNTNTYYRYSISPTVKRRFKDLVDFMAKYAWDEQFNSSEFERDSHRHTVISSIKNATPSRWSRKVDGRYTKVEYGDSFNGVSRRDTELASTRLSLGYQIDRRWQINGFYGEEWNRFETDLNGDKDGTAWDLGVRWTPTERTTVAVGQGNRFFGKTPRVLISHRHKRHTFSGNYRKSITFDRDIRTQDLGGFEGNINNPSVLSNGPILDERIAAGWAYDGRRTSLSVRGNYSQQTRSEDGAKSNFKDVILSVSPRLSSRYNLSGSIGWSEDEPRGRIDELPDFDDESKSETWTYNANISRSYNNKLTLSLDYRFTDRDGDDDFNDYQENRITATLSFAL